MKLFQTLLSFIMLGLLFSLMVTQEPIKTSMLYKTVETVEFNATYLILSTLWLVLGSLMIGTFAYQKKKRTDIFPLFPIGMGYFIAVLTIAVTPLLGGIFTPLISLIVAFTLTSVFYMVLFRVIYKLTRN